MAAHEKENCRRTLVEFYDREYLENVISLLCGSYRDAVYVYFSGENEPEDRDREALTEFVRNNFGFAPRFVEIREHTVDRALRGLRTLTNSGGEYDFDITGGSSVFIAAVGALAVEDGGKRIFLHEYDVASGRRTFSYPENTEAAAGRQAKLTVDQILALRGIEIMHPQRTVRYRLEKDDLRGEILRLWEAIRDELKAWNNFNSIASAVSGGPDCFYVSKRMSPGQRSGCRGLLEKLESRGIISQLSEQRSGKKVEISYRLHVPRSARFLYEKGGNILELLTYMAAVDSGRFADCCTGISLDWSSVSGRGEVDPYNEIDTVLTRGHIPFFISCKNSDVTNDYLYEIMVMARHYGGRYAVPALMCTTRCNVHLHARAREMGVVLVDDIARRSAREFSARLISALDGE